MTRLALFKPARVITAWAVLLVAAGSAASAASANVAVFPIPGGRVASPQTQITFRGAPVGQLGTVSAVGSGSGTHRGRLAADSDGDGGSFIPLRPFRPGERVTVTAAVPLSGTSHSYSFTVARPARPMGPSPLSQVRRTPGDVDQFQSRPTLHPPALRVVRSIAGAAPGSLFLGNQNGPVQNGVIVLDPTGRLAWFKATPKNTFASDVRVQSLNGSSVLTWWEGGMTAGVGTGVDVIDDQTYHQIATVQAGNGLHADLHEFQLTAAGTALITAYYPVYWDARAVHATSHTPVLDSVVQEIDVKTGLVLFQWDSLDHVPITDSESRYSPKVPFPYDYFHVNSIQQTFDGSLLISARNTWAGYDIDHATGAIRWALGGRHSTFKLGPGAQFAWQHDIRTRGASQVTVFDDGAGDRVVHRQSRGMSLTLDFAHHVASRTREYNHSPGLLSFFEGNAQLLDNGNLMVGWGQQPYFTEFDPSGRVVFDERFVDANSSYRVYRLPWTGAPQVPPAVAAHRGKAITAVYASWNGATNVASWRVLAGSTSTLVPVSTAARTGFETRIVVGTASYVAVQALDAAGNVLARSPTVRPR